MDTIFNFITGLIELFFIIVVIAGIIAYFGYNSLRPLAESVRESWSNIGVAGRKQASLINQLIDVVKGYQESEKLVMLKISDDMSTASSIAQMHQKSGMVLSTINNMSRQFPELNSNQQYLRLIDSIQSCETQMENARQEHNKRVKEYNSKRSSIPSVFYAHTLGFKPAPYLEFDGSTELQEIGSVKAFSSADDGERLNALLGKAGSKILDMSSKAIETGKEVTHKAVGNGKAMAEKNQTKFHESKTESNRTGHGTEVNLSKKFCKSCGISLIENSKFCSACGTEL